VTNAAKGADNCLECRNITNGGNAANIAKKLAYPTAAFIIAICLLI